MGTRAGGAPPRRPQGGASPGGRGGGRAPRLGERPPGPPGRVPGGLSHGARGRCWAPTPASTLLPTRVCEEPPSTCVTHSSSF